MIGSKIRKKRKELGLSLKELAEKTELTSGFLSQIERDLAEPSIASLRKISEALHVAIFYFLMNEHEAKAVVRKEDRQTLNVRDCHMKYQLLSPDLNRQMEMIMGELEPGGMTSEEPLSHAGEEVTYVLKGKMWIQVGSDEYTLEEGDTIYYIASIPHKIVNVGDENMIFISTITPPLF